MKQPNCKPFSKISYAIRPFGHWLAPVLALLIVMGVSCLAVRVQLPEKLEPYSIFFLILSFLFTAFFLLTGMPCAVYSGYLSVRNMVQEKRYVIPACQLLLDAALLAAWVIVLRKMI